MSIFRIPYILTFGISVIAMAGCSEDAGNSLVHEELYGKWNWILSYGGGTGHITTPKSEGITRTIEYIRDTVQKYYENDSLVGTDSFHFLEDSKDGSFTIRVFYTQPYPIEGIDIMMTVHNHDTLFASPVANDLGTGVYVREK
jgi:hypothetical protein